MEHKEKRTKRVRMYCRECYCLRPSKNVQREDDDCNELDEVKDETSSRCENKDLNDGEDIDNDKEEHFSEPNPECTSPQNSKEASTKNRISNDDIPNNWFSLGSFPLWYAAPLLIQMIC